MASYAAIHSVPSEHGSSRPASISSQSRRGRHSKQAGVSGSASWASSVVNLVNTVIGAGILAMPHALSNMGILLGTLAILWSATTSGLGLYLQTRCARYLDRGSASFFALSQITYPNAAVIFDAAIAIKCFGVAISYLIIIGDLMPGVVRGFDSNIDGGHTLYLVDRHFWITAFMLIVIPLSFLRRLDSLKYTSIIALTSIGYLIVLVVYHFASGDTVPQKGEIHFIKWQGAVPALASFPVMVFAYTCHQNMFSILNELRDPTPKRAASVVVTSIGMAASSYVLVAITGYLSFGSNIVGNIIAQYTPSVASTIGRAAIVVLVMFSYPLQVHPCRASLDAVLKWRPVRSKPSTDSTTATSSRGSPSQNALLPTKIARSKLDEIGELRFALLTTIIIILTYIVAMTVSSLDRVLAYVGSTGSTSISFILPGLFYYKISAPDSPQHQRLLKDEDDEDYEGSEPENVTSPIDTRATWRDAWSNRTRGRQFRRGLLRKLSLALAIYGFTVMIVCLIMNTFFVVAS